MLSHVLVPGVHRARVVDWIRQHALRAAGALPLTQAEVETSVESKLDPPGLEAHCRVPESEDLRRLRRNRLAMGTLRYEFERNAVAPSCSAHIESALARWREYEATGNLEHLTDIANLIAIEWRNPTRDTRPGYDDWMHYDDVGFRLEQYLRWGTRCCLAAAADSVRREWADPTHPNAHWKALDTGGHWSLRNQE